MVWLPKVVVWLPFFVVTTVARPQHLHDGELFGDPQNVSIHTRSSSDKNSIQILYEENVFSYAHNWGVYFGPLGIPVNPCNIEPFSKVYYHEGPARPDPVVSDIDIPPPTPEGTWSVPTPLYKNGYCSIVVNEQGPPTLECGQDLVVKFARDPGYDDATIGCYEDVIQYHRAYSAEYTA
jgi:hypothetical protein